MRNQCGQTLPTWRAPEGPEGPAAVPVGGGGTWPGFETTRPATHQRPGTAGVEGAGGSGGHGRASRRGAERSEALASRAAGPSGAQNTSGATSTSHTTAQVRQRGGYRSTRPLSAHSATASSRLRPNDRQSWRRRRIHRNMPPTTAAPRPAPPIRPSKPVRARPFFGLVAGTSGAT